LQPHSTQRVHPLEILTSAELDEVLRDAVDGYLCRITKAFTVLLPSYPEKAKTAK
jgi:hypothetical protein